MEMKFDISKMVEEIAMQAEENQEEFIFQTIRPYCENILQIKINKEELKQILLNGIQKQQPCEDCISRKDALDVIEKEKQGWEGSERYAIDECHTRIAELPSVTPKGVTITDFADRCRECGKQKEGKWIDNSKEDGYYANCSHCGYQIDIHYERGYLNYCPNCGAKMQEVEE